MSDLEWSDIQVTTPGDKPARAVVRKTTVASKAAPALPLNPTERSAPQPTDWGHAVRSPVDLHERRVYAVGESRQTTCWRCDRVQTETCVGHSAGGAHSWELKKCQCRR